MDSLPVWPPDEGIDDYRYWGQSHKSCYYKEKKSDFYLIKLKRVAEQADKAKAKGQKDAYFAESLCCRKSFETR